MTHMKTATIRDVQHHFNQVLQWIGAGEEVQITRRSRPVAKLTAIDTNITQPIAVDFYQRSLKIWGSQPASLSDVILESREERI